MMITPQDSNIYSNMKLGKWYRDFKAERSDTKSRITPQLLTRRLMTSLSGLAAVMMFSLCCGTTLGTYNINYSSGDEDYQLRNVLPTDILTNVETALANGVKSDRLHGTQVAHDSPLFRNPKAVQPLVYDPKTTKVYEELMSDTTYKVLSFCYNKSTAYGIGGWLTRFKPGQAAVRLASDKKGYFSDSHDPQATMKKIMEFIGEYQINPKDIPSKKHEIYVLPRRTESDLLSGEDLCKELKSMTIKGENPAPNTMDFDTDATYELLADRSTEIFNKSPTSLRCHILRNTDGSVRDWYFKGDIKNIDFNVDWNLKKIIKLEGHPSYNIRNGMKHMLFDIDIGTCSDDGCEMERASHTECTCGKVWLPAEVPAVMELDTGRLNYTCSWKIQLFCEGESNTPLIRLEYKSGFVLGLWETKYLYYKKSDKSSPKETVSTEGQALTLSMLEKKCSEFKTLNDFFSRGMADKRRPNIIPNGTSKVAIAEDGSAPLISAADSRVMVYKTIEAATKFWVKEQEFNLGVFLGTK